MTRLPAATAELVVGAVEAVVAAVTPADVDAVADFLDVTTAIAQEALDLAEDLGLVTSAGTTYVTSSPLSRLFGTPVLQQRAALLRLALEMYEPFVMFRLRLHATGSTAVAAQQTKAALGLVVHREVVKDTLISLGTYTQSLQSAPGGIYTVHFQFEQSLAGLLGDVVAERAEAELRVLDWLDEPLRDYVSRQNVLGPLADAYIKASQGDARGAVVAAGNAVESYLSQLANDYGVNVATAHGLGAKIAALENAGKLPKKIVAVGRYLSNVRNAADHGVDPDIGAAWAIRDGTGIDFLRVAINFMGATMMLKQGTGHAL